VHNNRLVDALGRQAYTTLTASPGAPRYYDELRTRGMSHHAALRQLANRLVGILHGCLKLTPYTTSRQRGRTAPVRPLLDTVNAWDVCRVRVVSLTTEYERGFAHKRPEIITRECEPFRYGMMPRAWPAQSRPFWVDSGRADA
jgi:hypothetical protein